MSNPNQLTSHGLFDAQVPRYTSYPTALEFNQDVGRTKTEKWLRAIAPKTPVSLYMHIPFCRRLCWFCACRTQGTTTDSPLRAYLDTLKSEIVQVADLTADIGVQRIHWGGGTPTILPPKMIDELAQFTRDSFSLTNHPEFSVEIDPTELDEPRIAALAQNGMTRASVGVQDFTPEIQLLIGRLQSYEVTEQAITSMRANGVDSLNIDILYGLPNQTNARITDTVRQVIDLNPDRVALFGYAHVPRMAKRQVLIPTETLPEPAARLALFETAQQLFMDAGYVQIGIDHFAKPTDSLARAAMSGQLRRNFQGYTDDTCDTLIGFGASAISRYQQGYTRNAKATLDYHKTIRMGQLATSDGLKFSTDDRIRGAMIEALMCDYRIDIAALAKRLGVFPKNIELRLQDLRIEFDDCITETPGILEIKPQAHALVRLIAHSLDAYRRNQSAFSTAI